jgi:hypothetical protein
MSRTFFPPNAYKGATCYELLPFRFTRFTKDRELLVNEVGEYLFVPIGTVTKIVDRQLEFGLAIIWLVACTEVPGRVRITRNQAIGVYESKFANGQERLELRSDGSYLQEFVSQTKPFHHTGNWHLDNHLFDGSDIVLVNAIVGEDDRDLPLTTGNRRLNVHKESGTVALARNEVMDLYYERVR